ncbi:hypothetical protein [Rhodococcus qingshengii]|uniref:hypothetical protein n=1 Tax=Rhodococcus qingshengii TaxID=334542 RepID=UPI001F13EF46|nr:hypothetical protein [Rhodococcus qingshengii]ULD38971.1 hypothetical protein JKI97_00175 [Rhodococcus qingshengii]
MSPKRGDRVAPPPAAGGWELRFATNEAAKGWEDLCQQAPGNTRAAWEELCSRADKPTATPRHHQLKGSLATASHRGVELEQWQFEVTAAGRIWYLVDGARRVLWVKVAGTGHPKATE